MQLDHQLTKLQIGLRSTVDVRMLGCVSTGVFIDAGDGAPVAGIACLTSLPLDSDDL